MTPLTETSEPLVTVITPAYNRASYLRETIDGVLNQRYRNIEYIVLDDGSTDDTRRVLEQYGGRLQWKSHANMGETRTVNKGLSMARGEFVTVVNSDDPILPDMIEAEVAFMKAHPDVLVVYPDWLEIDEHSRVIKTVQARDYDYPLMVRTCACVVGPGALLRRSAVEKAGSRDLRYTYVADFDYWLRLGLHGPFARIPRPLATHRLHPGSAGLAQCEPLAAELVSLMEDFFTRRELPPSLRALRAEALSAANYDAGIRCAGNIPMMLRYLLRSFVRRPVHWLTMERYRQLSAHAGSVLAAQLTACLRFFHLYAPTRRVWRAVKSMRNVR